MALNKNLPHLVINHLRNRIEEVIRTAAVPSDRICEAHYFDRGRSVGPDMYNLHQSTLALGVLLERSKHLNNGERTTESNYNPGFHSDDDLVRFRSIEMELVSIAKDLTDLENQLPVDMLNHADCIAYAAMQVDLARLSMLI